MLNFVAKPKITVEPRYKGPQKLKAGSTLTLPAEVTGSPKPKLTWYREGIALEKGPDVKFDQLETMTTLKIADVTGKQSGIYKLVAENEVGSDFATFEVKILGQLFDSPLD